MMLLYTDLIIFILLEYHCNKTFHILMQILFAYIILNHYVTFSNVGIHTKIYLTKYSWIFKHFLKKIIFT